MARNQSAIKTVGPMLHIILPLPRGVETMPIPIDRHPISPQPTHQLFGSKQLSELRQAIGAAWPSLSVLTLDGSLQVMALDGIGTSNATHAWMHGRGHKRMKW